MYVPSFFPPVSSFEVILIFAITMYFCLHIKKGEIIIMYLFTQTATSLYSHNVLVVLSSFFKSLQLSGNFKPNPLFSSCL